MPRRFWRRFARRSPAERWLVAEAVVWHTLAWLAVRGVPFRSWSHRLGAIHQETPRTDDPTVRDAAERTAWAVACVKRGLPWHATCLMEAVAAKMMLTRRGIPSTLYLGVVPARGGTEMEAHAWLRCGTVILTGATGHERFTTVTAFGFSGR